MPLTKNKLDSFVKRLDIAERFIKEEYILKKKEIKATVSELFDEFNFYCTKKNNQKEWGKIKFTKRLDELKIKFFKSNDKNKYHVSLDELNEIAKSRHWIHELDEFTENNECDSDDDPYDLDTGIQKNNKNKELEEENNKLKSDNKDILKSNEELEDENNKLKLELEDLKKQLQKPAPIKKVVREITSESESESDSDDDERKPIKLPNKYKKYEIFKNTSHLVSASREYIQKVLKEDYYDYWEFGESMTNEYFFGIIHDKLKVPL
jgi:hypothetical protein